MEKENFHIIELLNSITVTKKELSDVLDEADVLHDNGMAENGDGIYLVSKLYRGQPEKARAIYFRMVALSRIIKDQRDPGWTLPSNKDGAILTKNELIKSAVTFPLSEVNGDIGFEINGFLTKALEFAEAEGRA